MNYIYRFLAHTAFVFFLAFIEKISCEDVLMEDMVTWINFHGGSFNKLEIRRSDLSNDSSPFGIFATEDINSGEEILFIPSECYIKVSHPEDLTQKENEISEVERYFNNLCELSGNLGREMQKGEESDYAPYIAYLKTLPTGQIPSTWSEEGKSALRDLLAGAKRDVVDYLENNAKTKCINNDFEEHMLALTIQRGFDTTLIPVWDMVNHANGDKVNTENDSMYENGGLVVRASKDIMTGDEIFASYDQCADCKDTHHYWGTIEIMRDFGFVESYPHRYVFDNPEYMWFEVHEEGMDNELTIEWDDIEHVEITYEGLEFMETFLKHVESSGSHIMDRHDIIPSHEYNVIYSFYMAVIMDLPLIISEVREYLENLNADKKEGNEDLMHDEL